MEQTDTSVMPAAGTAKGARPLDRHSGIWPDWGSPAAAAILSPSSLVWLPGMTWRSEFSGDGGKFWARVARSALRYCSRVTWRTDGEAPGHSTPPAMSTSTGGEVTLGRTSRK